MRISDWSSDVCSSDLWWRAAFGFDWLYDKLFVQPYLFLVRVNRRDVADQAIGLIPRLTLALNTQFTHTQTGQLRWYAGAMAAGAVAVAIGRAACRDRVCQSV